MKSNKLRAELEEKDKIIEYLKRKFEEETGNRIALPSSLGEVLGETHIPPSYDAALPHLLDKEEQINTAALATTGTITSPKGSPTRQPAAARSSSAFPSL